MPYLVIEVPDGSQWIMGQLFTENVLISHHETGFRLTGKVVELRQELADEQEEE